MAPPEHIVVLMLENRSYDHLLGLLSTAPEYEGVVAGDMRFSNPFTPPGGKETRVSVTDDGNPRLNIDPPHSHVSAQIQTGINKSTTPTMEGFVEAYARKLKTMSAGDPSDPPDFHWLRIGMACVVLLALFAAPLSFRWRVPLLIGATSLEIVLLSVGLWLWGARSVLPFKKWWVVFIVPPLVIAAATTGSAWLSSRIFFWARLGLVAAALMVVALVVSLIVRKKHPKPKIGADDARRIMACMSPDEIPALAKLARAFTVCTQWYCSLPGATWPNRNFAHSGTSQHTVDIGAGFYTSDTIFTRLEAAGQSWRIYRDPESVAQVMAYKALWDDERIKNWRVIDDFAGDVVHGQLAAYTFIEPCHEGLTSNSQHPGNNDFDAQVPLDASTDFLRGEQLIADVYEALRANPTLFTTTMLIITYDEHGGFYDHLPPPTDAVPPSDESPPWNVRLINWFASQPLVSFKFKVLGPRVPAVVVGGCVPCAVSPVVFDHSSIPRTVRKLFAPDSPPLSNREKFANTFDVLACLPQLRTDVPDLGPESSNPPGFGPKAEVPIAISKPRDDEFAREIRRLALNMNDEIRDRLPGFEQLDAGPVPNSVVGERFTQLAGESS